MSQTMFLLGHFSPSLSCREEHKDSGKYHFKVEQNQETPVFLSSVPQRLLQATSDVIRL